MKAYVENEIDIYNKLEKNLARERLIVFLGFQKIIEIILAITIIEVFRYILYSFSIIKCVFGNTYEYAI